MLVGTSHYDDATLHNLPAVKNNLEDLRSTLLQLGMSDTQITVLSEPAHSVEISKALFAAADEATDVLLFYYSGHGLLDDVQKLYLSVGRSSDQHVEETSLSFGRVRRLYGNSHATCRVVILDCCWAGKAFSMTQSSADKAIDVNIGVTGAYTLASSAADETSLAPIGERHTAFTGAMIEILTGQDGRDRSKRLTLRQLDVALQRSMDGSGLPRPHSQSEDSAGNLVIIEPDQPAGQDGASTDEYGSDDSRSPITNDRQGNRLQLPSMDFLSRRPCADIVPLPSKKTLAELATKSHTFVIAILGKTVDSPEYEKARRSIASMGDKDIRAFQHLSARHESKDVFIDAYARLCDAKTAVTIIQDTVDSKRRWFRRSDKQMSTADVLGRHVWGLQECQDQIRRGNAALETERANLWTLAGKLSEYWIMAAALSDAANSRLSGEPAAGLLAEARGRTDELRKMLEDSVRLYRRIGLTLDASRRLIKRIDELTADGQELNNAISSGRAPVEQVAIHGWQLQQAISTLTRIRDGSRHF